jgi:hypothetical protein
MAMPMGEAVALAMSFTDIATCGNA